MALKTGSSPTERAAAVGSCLLIKVHARFSPIGLSTISTHTSYCQSNFWTHWTHRKFRWTHPWTLYLAFFSSIIFFIASATGNLGLFLHAASSSLLTLPALCPCGHKRFLIVVSSETILVASIHPWA